jgi:hypothetical protein
LSYLTLSITKDRGGGALLRFIVDFKTQICLEFVELSLRSVFI